MIDVTTACVFQHLISSFPAAGLRCLYPMLQTTRSHDNGQLLAAPTTAVKLLGSTTASWASILRFS